MPAREVVVITGSSGFIGAPLIRALATDRTVVGFDRAGDPHPPIEAECVCVDLTADDSVEAGLARVRYAYGDRLASVVHLAAYYDFSGAPSPQYDAVTVQGTGRLLDALQAFEVEQFVFSSTMLVHRPVRVGERIDERSPLGPTWPYPASKVATEQVVRERRGAIPAVLVRMAGVYDDVGHTPPLANQIRRIWERRPTSHLFPASPSTVTPYLHIADLIDALVAVVDRRRELPDEVAILLGEEDAPSFAELQHLIADALHGEPWRTVRVPKLLAKAGAWLQDFAPVVGDPFLKPWMVERTSDHYALDATAARTLLGWRAKRSLRDGIPVIAAALKDDPASWYRANGLEPPPGGER
ncbi:MAG: NAD-dependent epimerase/dehydratase family protein [Acidimicrobiales bacterium]